ncbi:MAG TPA: ABC transporter substrate-binding protein [Anaeromyxobacteraceae bacterium]|nr:ABC transporter substrate-binding protein [Anaeromyxobacteraceae bacterium]
MTRLRAALAGLLLPAAAAAGVRPTYCGCDLAIGLPAAPRQWDPARAMDPVDLLALGVHHATPLVVAPAGLAPGLLAEVPEPQAGGRAFRLVLKPDLRFADGTPLGAADLAASLARLAQPGTPHGWIALPIDGADAVLDGRPGAPAGIQVLSDREVLVTLSFPLPDFPAALATIPAAVVSARGFGAGPFAGARPVRADGAFVQARANDACAQGRPFADTASLGAVDPRGAARQLERALSEDGLLLVLRPEAAGPGAVALPARTATYAALGPRLGAAADAVRAALGSIDRAELARLYVRGPSEPLATLLPSAVLPAPLPAQAAAPAPAPGPRRAAPAVRIALLVLSASSEQRAVVQRLQVKLFDRGIQSSIETADAERFWPRVTAGDYDVALVPVPLLAARPAIAAGEVAWALRGAAAARRAMASLSALPPSELGPALQALARDLDAIPLFASGLRATPAPALQGLAPRPDGTIDFGDLWVWQGASR